MQPRRPRTVAFGLRVARRGGLVAVGLTIAALVAVASVVALLTMRGGSHVEQVPVVASEILAWGAGVTIAFGSSRRAMWRDQQEGLWVLARCRGVTAEAYLRGRVGGLAILMGIAVVGGTAVVCLATAASAPTLATVRACAGALAYSGAFCATMAPVALAALGASTTGGGYAALIAILVVPELVSPWTASLLPPGWHELTSVPAALDALRAGIAFPGVGGLHAARAVAALVAVVAASLVFLLGRIPADEAP